MKLNFLHKTLFSTNLISEICSDTVLESAKAHIFKARKDDGHNSDVWSLSLNWETLKPAIREELMSGQYCLSPVQVYGAEDGNALTRWNAQDAVVLKAISIVLTEVLKDVIDPRCYHLAGNGGLKGAVRDISEIIQTGQFKHIIKSDIANYYASIDHNTLLALCEKTVKDKKVLNLLHQYMNRVEVRSGNHDLIKHGIIKGCPLSPLMGALMLKSLDKMIPEGCAYARYMDDWVILVRTRRELRRVLKNMHGIVRGLKLNLALDKTYIGRISKGFDFLGFRLDATGIIGLAQKTIINHLQKLQRLYEQGASDQRVLEYKRNFVRWTLI